MDDLISRSEVIKLMYEIFEKYSVATDKQDKIGGFGMEMFMRVREIPTAYDVEKVIAAIDEALIEFNDGTNCTECVFKDVCDDGYEGCVETMVSVCKNTVRKGGVK